MRDSDEPYGRWLDLLGELLRQPLTALPHETLVYTLIDTFQANSGSWNWFDGAGNVGGRVWPPEFINQRQIEEYHRTHFGEHPLLRWFGHTGASRAQTIARVPPVIAGQHSRRVPDRSSGSRRR